MNWSTRWACTTSARLVMMRDGLMLASVHEESGTVPLGFVWSQCLGRTLRKCMQFAKLSSGCWHIRHEEGSGPLLPLQQDCFSDRCLLLPYIKQASESPNAPQSPSWRCCGSGLVQWPSLQYVKLWDINVKHITWMLMKPEENALMPLARVRLRISYWDAQGKM